LHADVAGIVVDGTGCVVRGREVRWREVEVREVRVRERIRN
jgi:hypothetical protein